MKYKYRLEIGSRKHHCPQCEKKTFVRYLDNETGEYLSNEFGRCDRENKCGYFAYPEEKYTNSYEVKFTPPPPTSFHDPDLISQAGRNFKKNNFIQFLKTLFSKDEVKAVILKYLIGTSSLWNGATIFWQIDNKEQVRHGKIMLYNANTGKRAKSANGKAYINSVRSALKLKNFNLKQCLFGLHLINETDTRTVAIVEGEKTAVIMSIFKPKYIWLATGSKHGFKYEMLEPLNNYRIIAFPDKGEYADWTDRAIELKRFGFDISVSKFLEEKDYVAGTDLADVYMTEAKDEPTVRSIAEKTAIRLNKINPSFKTLVDTFDLTDRNGLAININ